MSIIEPNVCPNCRFDFCGVKGTSQDVIGIFGLRTNILMGWKCLHCSYEWDREFVKEEEEIHV